jgi:hypothetical protein
MMGGEGRYKRTQPVDNESWRRESESVVSSVVSAQIMPDFPDNTNEHRHYRNQHLYRTSVDVSADSARLKQSTGRF